MAWRKSWAFRNIHGNGNGECSKRKLSPDERSVWDDYLDMATPPNTPIAGQVCIAATVGYTPQQLREILKTDVEVIIRANKRMQEIGMVTIENNGIVVVNNWKQYQSDYERQKGYREPLQLEVTTGGYFPGGTLKERKEKKVTQRKEKKENIYKQHKVVKENTDIYEYSNINKRDMDKRKKYIRNEYKSIYPIILIYWNEKKIILHKYLTNECIGSINKLLESGYTIEELKRSIDNYSYIIKSPKHFWSYRWTLQEFLRRGLDKFSDLDIAKQNYINKHKDGKDQIEDWKDELEGKEL